MTQTNNNCIFCKIIRGEIPAVKIWEDEKFIAMLDINPINPGHTLIIPKKHYEDIYAIPNNDLINIFNVAKIIAEKYRNIFNIKAINLISSNGFEGILNMGINFYVILFAMSYKNKKNN